MAAHTTFVPLDISYQPLRTRRDRFRRVSLVGLYLLAIMGWQAATCEAAAPEISATFSIVAIDPEQGLSGAAVASKYPDVGHVVPYVRAGVGAFCTQHYHVPEWGPQVLEQLEQGIAPEKIIAQLLAQDDHPEQRQLALIDSQGRVASHNPTQAPPQSHYWGSIAGRHYACQGNTLAGRQVLTEMSREFEECRGSFADKLVASLWAGDRAGGDHRGRLAAAVVVAKKGKPGIWFELHVDQSDDAVRDLVTQYSALPHPARGTHVFSLDAGRKSP